MTKADQIPLDETFRYIENALMERYGPILSDENLAMALGYRTLSAFRKSVNRKTVPVPVFTIQNRKGKFALTKDVASWLARKRNSALNTGGYVVT